MLHSLPLSGIAIGPDTVEALQVLGPDQPKTKPSSIHSPKTKVVG